MDPRQAGAAIVAALDTPKAPLTVADVAAKTGLALRDAEQGLKWLSAEYRGQLRVTESGELVHLFPFGFDKPWETRDRLSQAFAKLGRGLLAGLRFVVRAWVMIVLVAYVAIFLAVAIGLMVASQNDRNDRRGGRLPGGELAFVLLRILGDAFFWTFHPFSPFAVGYGYAGEDVGWGRARPVKAKDETPFYEKVNRYFFGPARPPVDPREQERRILAELRAQKGRIGLADVMRVTGLPREEADPLMARLMLDYEGDVSVSEDGGIFYRFEAMRRTADEGRAPVTRPKPAWEEVRRALPLTGNTGGTNVLITLLNGFNVAMSLVAIDLDLTLSKLPALFGRVPLGALPHTGTPIALGYVPLLFSLALFILPLVRAAFRPLELQRVRRENGRLAILETVLTRIAAKRPVTDEALSRAYEAATGEKPDSKEVTRRVVELGGGADVDSGEVRYRFVDLETEAAALEAEREQAPDDEKKLGRVVFATDN